MLRRDSIEVMPPPIVHAVLPRQPPDVPLLLAPLLGRGLIGSSSLLSLFRVLKQAASKSGRRLHLCTRITSATLMSPSGLTGEHGFASRS